MDAARWPQEIGVVKTMEETGSNTCTRPVLERRARPQEHLNCPRCHSTNTKFCYYNNYSLSQPRYFCKTCRRYWTEGGSLRNVPVGGGSRKNKRSSSSKPLPDLNPPNLSQFSSLNPNIHKGQDLNLGFPDNVNGVSQYVQIPKNEEKNNNSYTNSSSVSALALFRNENSFVPVGAVPSSNVIYSTGPGFALHEIKPSIGFSIDGIGSRGIHAVQENGGRILFPFGEQMKQIPSTNGVDQSKGQGSSTGYWNGMFGGGSW